MEFLIFFATLSIIFVIWLVIYSNTIQDVYDERNKQAVTDIGKSIQKQIFVASNARHGFSSRNLVLPSQIENKDYSIKTNNYVISIEYEDQEYVFHIPYAIGNLTKGNNALYNRHGVVCIGNPDCINQSQLATAQCHDGLENDNDFLIDKEDGACWFNYTHPYYERENDEPPGSNIEPDKINETYNYYVLCRNASFHGMCGNLTVYLSTVDQSKIGNATTLTAVNCTDHTHENFCS